MVFSCGAKLNSEIDGIFLRGEASQVLPALTGSKMINSGNSPLQSCNIGVQGKGDLPHQLGLSRIEELLASVIPSYHKKRQSYQFNLHLTSVNSNTH